MIKIAIPAKGDLVDDHFGHCEHFIVYSIDKSAGKKRSDYISSQKGCGCKSNIVPALKNEGVEIMLAGNMGNGALNLLRANGIEVFRGCSGTLENVIEEFMNGQIQDSGENCGQHARHSAEHKCDH